MQQLSHSAVVTMVGVFMGLGGLMECRGTGKEERNFGDSPHSYQSLYDTHTVPSYTGLSMLSMHTIKIRKVWSISWCNDYVSANISLNALVMHTSLLPAYAICDDHYHTLWHPPIVHVHGNGLCGQVCVCCYAVQTTAETIQLYITSWSGLPD